MATDLDDGWDLSAILLEEGEPSNQPTTTDMATATDSTTELVSLVRDLAKIEAKKKALEEQSELLRNQLMIQLKDSQVDKVKSRYGMVQIVRRETKIYPEHVRHLEQELKAEKKICDLKEDFEIGKVTESIRLTSMLN